MKRLALLITILSAYAFGAGNEDTVGYVEEKVAGKPITQININQIFGIVGTQNFNNTGSQNQTAQKRNSIKK